MSGVVKIQTANKACTLVLEARPLSAECTALLDEKTQLLKALNLVQSSTNNKEIKLNEDTILELMELKEKLNSAMISTDSKWEGVDQIWSFGPRHTGPNVLLNAIESYDRPSLWEALGSNTKQPLRECDNSIISGFQLATLSGPLCEEPMRGVCFVLKEWNQTDSPEQTKDSHTPPPIRNDHSNNEDTDDAAQKSKGHIGYGPFSGQLISAMKEGCRRVFLAQPARLMVALYTANILATADVLGKVYSVVGRRNGRILADEMKEGTTVFNIQALVPVVESFGFAEEMRKKTSGLASPQLIFSHWEV